MYMQLTAMEAQKKIKNGSDFHIFKANREEEREKILYDHNIHINVREKYT